MAKKIFTAFFRILFSLIVTIFLIAVVMVGVSGRLAVNLTDPTKADQNVSVIADQAIKEIVNNPESDISKMIDEKVSSLGISLDWRSLLKNEATQTFAKEVVADVVKLKLDPNAAVTVPGHDQVKAVIEANQSTMAEFGLPINEETLEMVYTYYDSFIEGFIKDAAGLPAGE